ncbi:hypothetical protein PTKIN_Ptkin12aG0030300 [Pterospermum kingtungense]
MSSKGSMEKEKDEYLTAFECLVSVAVAARKKLKKTLRSMKETKSRKRGLEIDNNISAKKNFCSEKTLTGDGFMKQGLVLHESSTCTSSMAINRKPCFELGESSSGAGNILKLKIKQSPPGDDHHHHPPPQQQPDLPERLKKMIKDMGGTDVKLIIQKPLYRTDLSMSHGRLSIPINQVQVEFLTPEEKILVNDKNSEGIKVSVIDPSLKTRRLFFRRWYMRSCSVYALRTEWKSVLRDNDLKVNDVIQVWSFRVESKLCFALVLV